jgi:hypothetical protein
MRTSLNRTSRAFVPIILGAALLVGCGDDDSKADETTTTAEVDPQAAIDQVNGICTRFEAAFADLATEEAELLDLAANAIDLYDDAIEDFKAVEASGDTADTLDKMIDSLEQARNDMQDAVESGDEDEVSAAGEAIDSRNEELDDEVREAGFTECNDDEPTDDTETTLEESSSGLSHVDLTDLLTAPTGYGLQSVDQETVDVLGQAFGSEPALVDLADRYGTTTVYSGDTPAGLLIFIGLKEVPDEATRAALLQSIAATGTDVETGTVAGSEGVKYTDSSGALTFATVRDDSILMAIAQDEAALEAIVAGLFEQNPDL